MRLQDKVCLVTGAALGIGLGIARTFAQEGAKVVMSDVNAELGEASAATVPNASFVACDVAQASSVQAMIQAALDRHGRIDVCVCNAGILRPGDVLEITEADFDAVIGVNLKGSFLTAQAAAREMVKTGGGAIIMLSSVNSVMTIPNQLPYNVSKGGINQLVRVMAVALANRGVRVNAIAPGSILTDMLKQVMADDAARRMILSRTPMGRCGEVDEIARIAVFLASEDSSYVTGELIFADGGRMGLNYVVPVAD